MFKHVQRRPGLLPQVDYEKPKEHVEKISMTAPINFTPSL
jgi:hypothetical protein